MGETEPPYIPADARDDDEDEDSLTYRVEHYPRSKTFNEIVDEPEPNDYVVLSREEAYLLNSLEKLEDNWNQQSFAQICEAFENASEQPGQIVSDKIIAAQNLLKRAFTRRDHQVIVPKQELEQHKDVLEAAALINARYLLLRAARYNQAYNEEYKRLEQETPPAIPQEDPKARLQRFAQENNVSMTKARKLLPEHDQAEIKKRQEYIDSEARRYAYRFGTSSHNAESRIMHYLDKKLLDPRQDPDIRKFLHDRVVATIHERLKWRDNYPGHRKKEALSIASSFEKRGILDEQEDGELFDMLLSD